MKRLAVALLATIAAFAAPTTANAVATQTTGALSSTTWTDLGVGPMRLYGSGSNTRYAISDSTPAAGLLGFAIGNTPIDIGTTSHVWVIAPNSDFNAFATYAPISSGSGGGGGGAVTIADGSDVTLGTTTDAATASTLIGLSKAIKASVAAGATAANQEVTAAGTSATSAQAVQGVTGGVPQATKTGAYTSAGASTSQFALSINSVTTLTVPSGSLAAQICVEGAAARYTDDGTTPSSTVGFPLPAGTCFQYAGPLASLKIIGAGATIDVGYVK